MSTRGVADLVAMLAVTSTRMSDGRPAMSMPLIRRCLLHAAPTATQAHVRIANFRKVAREAEKDVARRL
jgi:hypothetical protein